MEFSNCSASTAKMTATSVCPPSFCSDVSPSDRCFVILMASSANPTSPSPAMRNMTSRPLALIGVIVNRWAQPYASRLAAMMTAPPIVGVPRLVWCVVGPSSRMNCPYPLRTRNLMNMGVPNRAAISDTMAAMSTPFMRSPP